MGLSDYLCRIKGATMEDGTTREALGVFVDPVHVLTTKSALAGLKDRHFMNAAGMSSPLLPNAQGGGIKTNSAHNLAIATLKTPIGPRRAITDNVPICAPNEICVLTWQGEWFEQYMAEATGAADEFRSRAALGPAHEGAPVVNGKGDIVGLVPTMSGVSCVFQSAGRDKIVHLMSQIDPDVAIPEPEPEDKPFSLFRAFLMD